MWTGICYLHLDDWCYTCSNAMRTRVHRECGVLGGPLDGSSVVRAIQPRWSKAHGWAQSNAQQLAACRPAQSLKAAMANHTASHACDLFNHVQAAQAPMAVEAPTKSRSMSQARIACVRAPSRRTPQGHGIVWEYSSYSHPSLAHACMHHRARAACQACGDHQSSTAAAKLKCNGLACRDAGASDTPAAGLSTSRIWSC